MYRISTMPRHPNYSGLTALSMLTLTILIVSSIAQSIPTSRPFTTPASSIPAMAPNFGKLPLSFTPNAGQSAPEVRFQARGMGGTILFTPDELRLWLPTASAERQPWSVEDSKTHEAPAYTSVQLQFAGANPASKILGTSQMSGTINYLLGNNPEQWQTNLSTYAGVVYEKLYAGIDLAYDGQEGVLKGTYTVAPNTDPEVIRWRYAGAETTQVEAATGNLIITLPDGQTLTEQAPVAWQTINGQQVPVPVKYVVAADGQVSFALGAYNHLYELTIDPTLIYSTFLGGSGFDAGYQIELGTDGYIYVVGQTFSTDFYARSAYQNFNRGDSDIFVMKLTNDGSFVVYSTYIGGSAYDTAWGEMAIDAGGNVFIAGNTTSSDFPMRNAYQSTYAGGVDGEFSGDAFALKLGATGDNLIYSTYLGGSGYDYAMAGVVVDSAGNAYVAGRTASLDFPKQNAYQSVNMTGADGFVTKLNSTGNGLIFSTFLGGSAWDQVLGMALDSAGNLYATGNTASSNFPITSSYQSSYVGNVDAFVTKIASTGQYLIYSTYLGGSANEDSGQGITVDSAGNAYVTGLTFSNNFPSVNAYQGFLAGTIDTFVSVLNATGSALTFSTYLGGNDTDIGNDIAVNSLGDIYVTGTTRSANFPVLNAHQTNYGGGDGDGFFAIFDAAPYQGSTRYNLRYGTYLGGSGYDRSYGLALDGFGNAFIAGTTESAGFPVAGSLQPSFAGVRDGFVARIDDTIADIGFRPYREGYHFSNEYITNLGRKLTLTDVRRVFGDAIVCQRGFLGSLPGCSNYMALAWIQIVNNNLNSGRCLGMATTSLLFFKNVYSPTNFQGTAMTTYDLDTNSGVQQLILDYHIKQTADPVQAYEIWAMESTPSQTLDRLRTAMSNGASDPVILVMKGYDGWWPIGHAITPYAIYDWNNGVYSVMVYDNNNPGDGNLYLKIDTNTNAWEYISRSGRVWRGNASSHNLGAIPVSELMKKPTNCPWCAPRIDLDLTPFGQIWSSSTLQMLITDSQGQRLGYDGIQYLDEIPGAFPIIVSGGLGIGGPPAYTVPLTNTYTIQLTGQANLQQNSPLPSVTQFGPGYAVSVDNINLASGSQSQISIKGDGTEVVYSADQADTPDFTLAVDGDSETVQAHINGAAIGGGQVVTASLVLNQGDLVFNNAQNSSGTYNLELNRVSATGTYTFTHAAIPVVAGDTHYIDYGAWQGSGPMILNIDRGSNGTIDQIVLLGQVNRVYLPMLRR